MFGILRTALAVAVVADHFGGLNGIGGVAVFGFFCLSGFLMTLLMNRTYKDRPILFLYNRFLRLYPLLWATILLAIVLRLTMAAPIADGPVQAVREFLYLVRPNERTMLVPTSWAVSNELIFYALIAMGISATVGRSVLWLVVSTFITVLIYKNDPSVGPAYFAVLPATLPFSFGAVLFHLSKLIHADFFRRGFLLLLPAGALGFAIAASSAMITFSSRNWEGFDLSLYGGMAATGLVVVILYLMPQPRILGLVDTAIGRFSYPIYLTQFFGRDIAGLLFGKADFPRVLGVTTAISIVLILLVDLPVEVLRKRIRSGRQQDPAAMARADGGPLPSAVAASPPV